MSVCRVTFTQPNVVELQSVQRPPLEPGHVRIRTELTLISPGTEGADLRGLPNTPRRYPSTPGYSNVGIVEEAGPQVSDLQPGQRVTSLGQHMSEVVVPANHVTPVPEGVEPEEATFATLTAVSLQAVRKSGIELGEAVLVVGLGPVGNLALQLARLQGGLPIIGADLDDGRLSLARQVGAEHTVNPARNDLANAFARLTDGGPAVVIEATGSAETIVPALAAASRQARVVLLASTRGSTRELNFYDLLHIPGITLIGAHNSIRPQTDRLPGHWPLHADLRLAVQLMQTGRLRVAPLITHRFAADQAEDAYRLVREQDPSAVGIILDWR